MTTLHDVTWPVLMDGLLGGIIGTLGAFGAAALAIWYNHRQQRHRDDQRAADENAFRKRRAVASLTGLLQTLATEARGAPFLRGRTILALSTAMLVFEAEVGGDHPEVSKWLMDRYTELVPKLDAWHRTWWFRPIAKRRMGPVASGLGQLTATLTAWSTGQLTDAEVAAARFDQELPKARQ